jgi:cell division protein FtsN
MFRVILFSLVRFIVAALVIYFVLTLVRKVLGNLQNITKGKASMRPSQPPPKPKEEYTDVKDAKFFELRNRSTKDENHEKP